MSVVAVKRTGFGFEIAADDIAVCGWTCVNKADDKTFSKIRKINNVIIGGCGYSSAISLLFMYATTHLIKTNNEDGVFEWFCGFLDWAKEKTGALPSNENSFLIAFHGRAYFFNDYLCNEIFDSFAIGAGRDFALAALKLGHDAGDAVGVACQLSAFCCEPIHSFVSERQ